MIHYHNFGLGQDGRLLSFRKSLSKKNAAISGFKFRRRYGKISVMQFLVQRDVAGTKCSIDRLLPNPQYIYP